MGELINRILRDTGLNMWGLSKKMGVSVQVLISMRRAKKKIGIENLIRLWRASGMSAVEFILELEKASHEK